jgi:diguanylate cyclase (GGDEF)-like protein/putative nucleotidyltransferase with HDIG domain
VRTHKQSLRDVDALQQQLTAAERRITELERQLAATLEYDVITGLPSPNAFAQNVELELERCRRHGQRLSVAVVDIDGFRIINSTHGRNVGNHVLREVGQSLAQHTRATDLVTRSGGDEFLIALPETDTGAALQAFDRLMLELEALRVGPVECLTASVGIAEWSRAKTLDQLLEKAGERMRAAREAGGGRAEANGDSPDREATGHQDAILGLAEALTERDQYTGEHSEEVLDLVEQVARGLALDEQEVQRIRYAALLHDIGKVAIPDDILHKPDKLTDDEFEVMKSHTIVGERILRAIPGLGGVARIVRSEHERYDGTGYPDGLKGEEIPIGARIILACDAYHAMVSDRPYRKAMGHREAIRELGKNAGTQFDPQVTEVLIGALYSKRQAGELCEKPAEAESDPVAA